MEEQPLNEKSEEFLESAAKELSLDAKALNFLRSATAVVQSLARGEQLFCTNEIRDERQKICQGCEMRNPMQNTCLSCGCNLAMKIPFAAMECPLQKWGMDQETITAEVIKRATPEQEEVYKKLYPDSYK